MRKRRPSSVVLSKAGDADFKASSRATASYLKSGRTCKRLRSEAPAISMEELQERGKSGPALSVLKLALQKWLFLSWRNFSSAWTSSLSLRKCEGQVSGGMKQSPSSRRSERVELKMALNKLLSASLSTSALSRLDQKAPPTTREGSAHWKLLAQLPSPAFASVASERSNWPRLRSTPLGPGLIAAPPGPARTRRPMADTPTTAGAMRAACLVGATAAMATGTPGTIAGTPGTASCTPP
mmetsp:Transcript_106288/g.216750  ORF Transcript_106288/g.216750 Transcript_106288/m.216750 type:complete len:239 (-) Transcript_106288:304-1020(-)